MTPPRRRRPAQHTLSLWPHVAASLCLCLSLSAAGPRCVGASSSILVIGWPMGWPTAACTAHGVAYCCVCCSWGGLLLRVLLNDVVALLLHVLLAAMRTG